MANAKKDVYMAVGPNGIMVENYSTVTTEIDTANYIWMINNYSFQDAKGDSLRSPMFTAVTNDECKWSLILMPDVERKNKKSMGLHIYLNRASECKVVFGRFELSILDNQQKKIHTLKSTEIHKFDTEDLNRWGYENFILKDTLLNPTNNYLPNDSLTIYAEVTFSKVENHIDTCDKRIFNQFEHHILKDDLSEDLEQFFKNEDFADVVILVNGKRFQAHKFILTARSPVFAAMFKHNTKESKSSQVEITDIDENVIEEMLYYMYTGKFKNLDTLANSLLVAADKYGMDGMKARCENALLKNLSVENSAETLVLADLYHASELKSRAINFIVMKSTEVMNTKTWNKIVPSHPHLINEVCRALSRQSAAR